MVIKSVQNAPRDGGLGSGNILAGAIVEDVATMTLRPYIIQKSVCHAVNAVHHMQMQAQRA